MTTTISPHPPKTYRQPLAEVNAIKKLPKLPLMHLFAPGKHEAERKQLIALNEKLCAENASLSNRIIFWVSTAFIGGMVLGVLSAWRW